MIRAHSHGDKRGRRWWVQMGRVKLYQELAWLRAGFGFSFEFDDELGWGLSLQLPGLSGWWFLGGLLPRLERERGITFSVHSGAIWWTVWRSWRDGWSRDVPRWREGNFNFVDFLLGDSACAHDTIEDRRVIVPMPEGPYQARARLQRWRWKRPRWFAKEITRVQIDIEQGIPHEGKGENSWDCGVDATYGITTGPCRSIAQGVGILVGSVLESRVKYGGWGDWRWEKPWPVVREAGK